MEKVYFPVFLDIKDKLCVVVGGGKVAERKIFSLIEAGARVKVIAPEVLDSIRALAEEGKIELEEREYKKGDLEGARLVIAATNNQEVQKKVYEEAEERGIFCNVVDVPELCSFIVPSVVRRGPLCIAISTSGKAPAVAKRLRQMLESKFGEEYEAYLNLMGKIRELVLRMNISQEEKHLKLNRLALAPILDCIKYGDIELLKAILESEGLSEALALSELPFPNTSAKET